MTCVIAEVLAVVPRRAVVAREDPLVDVDRHDVRIAASAGSTHHGTSSSSCSRTISSPAAEVARDARRTGRQRAPRAISPCPSGHAHRAATGFDASARLAQSSARGTGRRRSAAARLDAGDLADLDVAPAPHRAMARDVADLIEQRLDDAVLVHRRYLSASTPNRRAGRFSKNAAQPLGEFRRRRRRAPAPASSRSRCSVEPIEARPPGSAAPSRPRRRAADPPPAAARRRAPAASNSSDVVDGGDQPVLERLRRAEPRVQQHQLHRSAQADEARQQERRALRAGQRRSSRRPIRSDARGRGEHQIAGHRDARSRRRRRRRRPRR